ncbi:MAG: cysteine desulfurase family protein [Pirellulaceae bacterium]|nr:cysteine desulfurase family protein [Pirellulaceae bacterium]
MSPTSIYLDHNATTPLDPRVLEAMARVWRECGANPASQHGPGRKARRVLEEARESIGTLLGAKTTGMEADHILFTSGGTEANNLALFGLAGEPGGRLVVSAIEHPSIVGPADELRRRGVDVQIAPVDAEGVVRVEALANLLETEKRLQLVSVMLANNETGVIQPVAEIAALCRERGVLMHTDAVQAVGKIPVSFRELGVAAMTVAPHKFHGPLGIGALVQRSEVKLAPQLFGGFQQQALRPGTESVALAAGFARALELWQEEAAEREARMRALRDELQQAIRSEIPEAVIIGEAAPRLPNVLNIAFPGLNRQALVMALDLAGVACSTGSACASGSSEPSPVLLAMGLSREVVEGSIRLSLGAFTTAAEVSEAACRISSCVKHLRRQK